MRDPDDRIRMGVDIGGTFTDVVLEGGARGAPTRTSTKVLTTHHAPELAILDGLQDVCAKAGIAPADIDQIIHGTTLATNALIERRGARTALITTAGFRDVIEMRTESRFEQYDLNLALPEPLLPRRSRYTLDERVSASGEVLVPLERAAVERLVDDIAAAGHESVAVGFLHSYVDDSHERLVGEVLAERLPEAMVSLSSRVSPQMREYERFSTTIANAYIKPLMKRYLGRLVDRLAAVGVGCPVFLMHSGGGIVSIDDAAEYPVRLVESGPAGGAVFAATLARRHGLDKVLSFDMGGTTAKICLIQGHAPRTARTFEVARSYRFKKGSGMPISIPVIDMVEIGAGGGSLAHVDAMRRIRVGPRSAGSDPGPACYARGGTEPAVTDADLVLGRLDPEGFAGGTMVLDESAARGALRDVLGTPLDMDGATAAWGLSEVVDENMANAARVHAVENGEDLAGYTMIAFGGAAPLHAARLCEKLGIARCLVPPGAGVGSAIGFLRAPFGFEATRGLWMPLAAFDAGAVVELLGALELEATSFVRGCAPDAPIRADFKAYMRYAGQGWEIPVALSADEARSPEAGRFRQRFEQDYANLFGRTVAGLDVEITVWAVNASTEPEGVMPIAALPDGAEVTGDRVRRLFDPALGRDVRAQVIERRTLVPGDRIRGPAIVTEDETTIVIPSSREATVQPDGCIDCRDVACVDARADDVARDATHGTADDPHSSVALQVMWNRLISIVEEQAQALVRTAFSTSVREAGDLSAGVYDRDGRMLAQAVTGTPGHVNAMADAVAHFIRRIGEDTMAPGDVYLTNDPWEGTGHLHDVTVVTPTFHRGARVGFFACTAHVVDIGGRGFGADAESVYEEGLYLPIMRFADRGTVDATLLRIVRGNVREPDQLVGDLHALASCNGIGERRLLEMLEEYSLADLSGIADLIFERSRAATLERIAALPRGAADGAMTIDGYATPIELKVRVELLGDRIRCDFAGSSDVDPKGINVPLVYTRAYACFALKCAIAPDIPNNWASLAPFEIDAPEGSILNAPHPAPVALRHVIGHMVPDTVYAALDALLPDTVPAEGAGTLCNFQLSLRPRTDAPAPAGARRAEVLVFNSGGSGARPASDGLNATAFPSGVMTMPVEATEHAGPVIVWRKELRPDSGGIGRWRGGLGQYLEVGATEGHEFHLSAMLDRVHHPARGRQGGGDGAPTRIARDDGVAMRGKGRQFVGHGQRVAMAFPGGAGYGPAAGRDPARVRADLADGYVSAESARDDYGLDADDVERVLAAAGRGEFFG